MAPYTKSALYLISNALEVRPRTALLGLEAAWWPEPRQEGRAFDMEERARFEAWQETWPPLAAAAKAPTRAERIAALAPNVRIFCHRTLLCNAMPRSISHRMLLQDDRIAAQVLEDIRAAACSCPPAPTSTAKPP